MVLLMYLQQLLQTLVLVRFDCVILQLFQIAYQSILAGFILFSVVEYNRQSIAGRT